MSDSTRAMELLCCYARQDSKLRDDLEKHLGALKRSGKITVWHDREIVAGTEWDSQINQHLDTADIILLLITHNFIASNYCYGIEMKRAMERYALREAHVIPILLRYVDWEETPISSLQLLPRNGKPVTVWRPRERAFAEIAEEIRTIVNDKLLSVGKLSAQSTSATNGEILRYSERIVIGEFDQERFQLLLTFERKRRYWSQQELADRMELQTTPDMINTWEQGESLPGLFHRQKLCELFEMTPEQLGWTDHSF